MFSLRTIRGTLSIILCDAIICYLSFWLVFSHVSGAPDWLTHEGIDAHLTFTGLTAIIVISSGFARFYSFIAYTSALDLFNGIVRVFFVSFCVIAALGFFVKSLNMIQWRLFLPLALICPYLFIFRYFFLYRLRTNWEQVLILGTTDQTREIIHESRKKRMRGYRVIGVVTLQESLVGSDFHGVPVVGLVDQVEEIVRTHGADSILVTLRDRRGKLPVRELLRLKVGNLRIQEGNTFYEKVKRNMIIDEFFKPSWIIFEEGFFYSHFHGYLKRMQGIIVSAFLLTLLSPVLLIVAVLIKLDSQGPVFYSQRRIGSQGKVFRLLKFRSMVRDAEAMSNPVFTKENDSRITRVGRIIRKIRLDEIPQLINIFKGDMNLVGPRPERPFFVKQLEELIPYYSLRNTVRPGVTGWAQVHYPYGDSLEDGKEKLKYDLYYLKHSSWLLDLLILFLTVKEVLFGKGR